MKENFIPYISVLIPVYNVEKYVEKCLTALFSNTIAQKCEFIIVNDCSSDSSMQVALEIVKRFPHLREKVVLRSHDCNRGLAAARNTALLQAHGKYIICVDSDDWVEPNYLERMYAEAECVNADIVGCNLIREEKGGSVYIESSFPCIEECVPWLLTGRLMGWLWQKMFRRNLIIDNAINWVDGLDMCEDLLFSIKAFCCAKRISSVSEYLYHYNWNPNSLTSVLDDKKIKQLLEVDEKIEEFLAGIGKSGIYRDEFLCKKTLTKIWICCGAKKLSRTYFRIYTPPHRPIYKYGSNFFSKMFLFFTHYGFDWLAYLLVWGRKKLKNRTWTSF